MADPEAAVQELYFTWGVYLHQIGDAEHVEFVLHDERLQVMSTPFWYLTGDCPARDKLATEIATFVRREQCDPVAENERQLDRYLMKFLDPVSTHRSVRNAMFLCAMHPHYRQNRLATELLEKLVEDGTIDYSKVVVRDYEVRERAEELEHRAALLRQLLPENNPVAQ